MLLHCVLLRLKSSVTADDRQELYHSIRALQHSIEGVHDVKYGPNVSLERLSGGFNDGFIITMNDEDVLEDYLSHESHAQINDKILELAEGGLSGVLVFDMNYEE